MSKQISSRMAEDSQERSYQGQGGCFASSRVCHYQPHSHKHKLLSTLQRASLHDIFPANNHVEIQQFPSAKNVQLTAIISRQPPMVISFVDESMQFFSTSKRMNTKPATPMKETTTFQMNSQTTEGISRCLVEFAEQLEG